MIFGVALAGAGVPGFFEATAGASGLGRDADGPGGPTNRSLLDAIIFLAGETATFAGDGAMDAGA